MTFNTFLPFTELKTHLWINVNDKDKMGFLYFTTFYKNRDLSTSMSPKCFSVFEGKKTEMKGENKILDIKRKPSLKSLKNINNKVKFQSKE